jgi:hypothetical protein
VSRNEAELEGRKASAGSMRRIGSIAWGEPATILSPTAGVAARKGPAGHGRDGRRAVRADRPSAATGTGMAQEVQEAIPWLSVEEAIEVELAAPGLFCYRLAVCPVPVPCPNNLDISSALSARDAIDRALLTDRRESHKAARSQDELSGGRAAPGASQPPQPSSNGAIPWLSVQEAIHLELEAPGLLSYRLAVSPAPVPGPVNLDISSGLPVEESMARCLRQEALAGALLQRNQ